MHSIVAFKNYSSVKHFTAIGRMFSVSFCLFLQQYYVPYFAFDECVSASGATCLMASVKQSDPSSVYLRVISLIISFASTFSSEAQEGMFRRYRELS